MDKQMTLLGGNSNLVSAAARGWGRNDDLTNGAWLDEHCPGKNRASDIDSEPWHHVLHNRHLEPHREAVIEYKHVTTGGFERRLPLGQQYRLRDYPGTWLRKEDELWVERRVFIVSYDGNRLVYTPCELMPNGNLRRLSEAHPPGGGPSKLAQLICGWVWPA